MVNNSASLFKLNAAWSCIKHNNGPNIKLVVRPSMLAGKLILVSALNSIQLLSVVRVVNSLDWSPLG